MSTTVTTTQLCKHFGVQFKPEILTEAGVEPVSKVKNGYNWNVSDIPAIADAIIEHVGDRRSKPLDLSTMPKAEKKAGSAKSKAHDPLNDDDDDDESL